MASTPATVSADVLPTVQVDGVVWSQVTIGNIVYAGGKFTTARPAGAAPGTSTTARGNLLAYDIRTGALVTSFAPSLNGQVRGLAASPDGSRLYVAGEFTQANGVNRYRIAAYSTATGQLISTFAPALDYRANAIVATASTVYVGGGFSTAAGSSRTRLAAFRADNGGLLPWAPAADAAVSAMVLTPDQSKLVVGGQFANLSGTAAYGMGALDASTGSVRPWAANQRVRNAGVNAGITSLRTDGNQIYGTGYVFGAGGNLEGSFAADPGTGALNWVEDCHGDSYDVFATGSVLYNVSHSHYCGNIGSFPETNPRTHYRATAFTTYPTRTITHDTQGYFDWYGTPAPTQLDWYPALDIGSFTGQNQAAWSATGNGSYLALGGEFPRVNGVPQQGLVRFAVSSIAPNKVAPRYSTTLTPHVTSPTTGTARILWTGTYDQDNEALTYTIVRDGQTATPVFTTTANSTFYRLPQLSFTDSGLTPGSSHTYRIYVRDPYGNVRNGDAVAVTVTASTSPYVSDVVADGAAHYWRLGEASGTKGVDQLGPDDLLEQAGVGHGVAGAVGGDADRASSFDGTTAGSAATTTVRNAPQSFTTEAWFRTTTTSGGKIVGFGSSATGSSSSYDRHTYMDSAGHVLFGVYPGSVRAVRSPSAYNDGRWHYAVATLSGAGAVLYVDGRQVGLDAGATTAQAYSGYWRIGGDNLGGWPSAPSSAYFSGAVDDVAVYPGALTATQVLKHYTDSGR